ncbi:tetrahydromethanopterin S-methyltransferase subunit MtrB [Methanogenium organophilum]|uniref:Tetrahydromethanopterin S-methyltransferase subunit B n=1 Tax=Methanogenium organophilum TaxID=2199 RepID=A0A9X9T8R8_METOG|nr:tetrahydromethanopterin S-methyltransferase subunit B [Methanogenium organophilum]WAI01945.1 tetrahydromethanopterin S-methyltransferase subunit B [Methanogenium organophilum]
MGYIQVLPEYGLVADPMVGLVTTAGASLGPVVERVEKLDKVADDIVNMLSGEGEFLASFPGRDQSLLYAGGVTAMWYGLAVGLFIAGIIAFGFL